MLRSLRPCLTHAPFYPILSADAPVFRQGGRRGCRAPQRYAGSRTPSRTGASRTSSISRSSQNCATAGTVRKFCRPSAGNTPTRASSSILKSKKIPRTPKNSNAGTGAANFTSATVLTPSPSITSGKANTTAYFPPAAPSPKRNSATSGKKF